MHPALHSQDILEEIFETLSSEEGWRCKSRPQGNLRALACSAAVCRAFHEPALNALWRRLDSVLPILTLLSSLMKVKVEESIAERVEEEDCYFVGRDVYILRGDIRESDWLHLQRHALRVRAIRHTMQDAIDPSVFSCLIQYNNGRPLLPSLEKLEWEQKSPSDTGIFSLITPSMRSLRFVYSGTPYLSGVPRRREYTLNAILQEVCGQVPYMQELHISGVGSEVSLSPLLAFENLHAVELCSVASGIGNLLQGFSNFEQLTELVLELTETAEVPRTQVPAAFPKLQQLSISGRPLQLLRLHAAISAPRLRALSLCVHQEPSKQIDVFLEHWCLKYTNLCTFCFKICYIETSAKPAPAPLLPLITPLLQLRDATVIDLEVDGHHILLQDKEMDEMTKAWPNLTTLLMKFQPAQPLPTAEALVHVAHNCLHLRALIMPSLDDSFIPALPSNATLLQHGLRQLELRDESMNFTNPDGLARFLAQLFPHLSSDLDPTRGSKRWREWVDILKLMRSLQSGAD